jgi:hypothetical protein
MGPGVALFDADGDGRSDILQLRMPPPGRPHDPAPARLYLQRADGRFAAEARGLEDPGYAQGVAIGDADGDGDLDVYFANYGADALYLNEGGRFAPAVDSGIDEPHWSSGATFCDADADGDLDLYVVRYLDFNAATECIGSAGRRDYCSPESFPGLPDALYLNDGAARFRPHSLPYPDRGASAKGLAVVCADLTGDGRLDFYVANDREPNQLWVASPDGWRDEAVLRGVAVNRFGRPEASMGLALGDVEPDGEPELFMTHLKGENNTLYGVLGNASPAALYRDRTTGAGMAEADWPLTGFGTAFADLDHDGLPDLLVVNGRVRHEMPVEAGADPFWGEYAEPNLVFVNRGGRFENGADRAPEFVAPVAVTRGLATADLDGDGDLDVVTADGDNRLRLFRNEAPPAGSHWLRVRPFDADGREALGARVTLVDGGRRAAGVALRGSSYQSSSQFGVHFGLGAAASFQALEVRWPDGARERFAGGAADRVLDLRRGSGEAP